MCSSMLLCDIGNTTLHFFDGKKSYKENTDVFNIFTCKTAVYYINVNPLLQEKLERAKNWINLQSYVDYSKYYKSMGIDRIMACEAVEDGIIIDAGSAITVDMMLQGEHQGGFIYPGLKKMRLCYANISSRLDYSFNFELDLDKMPKNTQDALSYGYLRLLYGEVMRHHQKIYLTGGHARVMHQLFKEAEVDELLLFKGMKRMMSRMNLC